jgi:hypothetical protein
VEHHTNRWGVSHQEHRARCPLPRSFWGGMKAVLSGGAHSLMSYQGAAVRTVDSGTVFEITCVNEDNYNVC